MKFSIFKNKPFCAKTMMIAATILTVSACSSDDSDESNSGFIKAYNASLNSPALNFSVDDNTYAQLDFSEASSYYEFDNNSYQVIFDWRVGDDSYETLYDELVSVEKGMMQLLVVNGDFSQPEVLTYKYENESPEEHFTFRFLNLHSNKEPLDLYIAEGHQSFEDAQIVDLMATESLSDSYYHELGEYKLFITAAGEQEVLFESGAIEFEYYSQYILVARDNLGPGSSGYSIDKLSKSSSVEEISDIHSTAEFKIYNGLTSISNIDFFLNNEEEATIKGLQSHHYSDAKTREFGDYSMKVTATGNSDALINNHLLTLTANSDKTIFFYTDYADDSNAVDEVLSITVDNSNRVSLYDHKISLVNFIQSHKFVDVYFVRSNETIETAQYKLINQDEEVGNIVLPNADFQVYVVAQSGASDVLLAETELKLDESTKDLFLVLNQSDREGSQYSINLASQND